MATHLSSLQFDILQRTKRELEEAAHGARAAIVKRTADFLGISVQTTYRRLESAGYDSGRRRRSDAGKSKVSDTDLNLLAGVLAASTNKKGQRMPIGTATEMVRQSMALKGKHLPQVSESTVSRLLYARRLHPTQIRRDTASVQLQSLHPNHVWQIDSTTGAYYYLPKGRLRWMPEDEFYKNKVNNLIRASTDLLTRYACVDHTTNAFKCRYYLGGETSENLLDFATWAMDKQPDSPMHGIPLILMTDPGAANKSEQFTTFCARAGIQHIAHAPGAARVTGSVEKLHDLVGKHFETRFRFLDPKAVSLESLNAFVSTWAASYCSVKVHTRHKRTRFGAWMAITQEQLRTPASLEVLRELAHSEPMTRRVSNDLRVSFKGREFDLSAVPGVVAGLRVTLQINVFRSPAIDVRFTCPTSGAESWHVVEPFDVNGWGYASESPVIGHAFRSAPLSDLDRSGQRLTREAYQLPTVEEAERARKHHAQAYADIVDAMADVHATPAPTFMPRRGTEHQLPRREVAPVRFSPIEACADLKRRLGEEYTPQVYAWVVKEFPNGVPREQMDDIEQRLRDTSDANPLHSAGGL